MEPPDLAYGNFTFRHWMGIHIASLLCSFHRGESITFPVDLLDYGIAMDQRLREEP